MRYCTKFEKFTRSLGLVIFTSLISIGLLSAQEIDPKFPYTAELGVLKELACQYQEYTKPNERFVIDNLTENELGVTAFMVGPTMLKDLNGIGLSIDFSTVPSYPYQMEVFKADLKNDQLEAYIVIFNSYLKNGTQIPLMSAVVLKDLSHKSCQVIGQIQTWDYASTGKTRSRNFYSNQGVLSKSFEVGRPLLSLEEIFPEYGECTDDFIYPTLKNAISVAETPRQVHVAVVDSGVDYNHPYLAPLITRNVQELQSSYDGLLPDDDASMGKLLTTGPETFSHGTAVAFAATQMDARIGLIPVLAFKDGLKISDGMDEAIAKGASIINLSLAAYNSESEGKSMYDVITKNPKVLFVVAAGNDGLMLTSLMKTRVFPAMLKAANLLVVGATDINGALSVFSNYGNEFVDVAYYGENVMLPLTQSGFFPLSGTSFASPLTAFVAAQMKMANPLLTPAQIVKAIKATSTLLPVNKGKLKAGVVNAKAAMEWAQQKK